MDIMERVRSKEEINSIIDEIIKESQKAEILVNTIKTDKSAIKFNCEKVLRLVSEKRPDIIYPYFDFFVELLDWDNKFLKWGAIQTIANLTASDNDDKFVKIFDKYYSLLEGPEMVSANNVIGSSVKIVDFLPDLNDKIVEEILKVQNAKYYYKGELSPECKNIACGEAVNFFYKTYASLSEKEKVFKFVESQANNTRPKVRKLVQKFIEEYK